MYPVSDRFKAAIKKSHVAVSRVELWYAGQFVQTLDVLDGNVTIDDQVIRRRCSIGLADHTGTLTPQNASSILGVVDSELRVYRGVRFPDGTEELVPLGIFGIASVQIDDSGEGLHLSVQGYDRSRRVSRAKMRDVYNIAAGTNYVTAIRDLIQFRYPAVQFAANFMTTPLTTPSITLTTGDDPMQKAIKMALEGLGADLYFDANGQLQLQPINDSAGTTPVWEYREGADATILYINSQLSNEDTYNVIVVTGEGPNMPTPLRGEAADTNPNSETYIGGVYGEVVDWISTQFTANNATQTTVDNIASSLLVKRLGFSKLVRFNGIVNAAHELTDVILIHRPDSKLFNEIFVVDKLTIPLTTMRAMEVSTRKRRV